LLLISSYYLSQWVADGQHAAVSQFTKSAGIVWVLAATAGGAVMGGLGALAGRDADEHRHEKALGLTAPALIVLVGPALWVLLFGRVLELSQALPAVAVFAAVGAGLLVHAVRTCGPRAVLRALVAATAEGAAALGCLLWLQTNGWLYLTF
jgi:hypothetical protein